METCTLDTIRTHPQDGVAYLDERLPYKNQSQDYTCGPDCLPHQVCCQTMQNDMHRGGRLLAMQIWSTRYVL